ncbi:hypothetical protein QQM39_28410 [Streptomyces sp. DT2A-34]|uniref:hypothetical protein n=1 Tax=Streptomyces sp. DT2A-34 TaxID=3051182 RepID=UPI00265BDE7C|nr:hypothetical protein [Streptomyces sp. DT2A-34]MDO0914615.1 hypothetical protein [Streptomyces sp. DT2A-34]
MSDALMPVLTANLDGYVSSNGITYIHDHALDGDEDLSIDMPVLISDGCGHTAEAKIIGRDEKLGYWYLQFTKH